jgi:hypothetical protein
MSSKGYAESKFLIYCSWDANSILGSVISGSILLDHAMTEEEAGQKVELYRERNITSSYKAENMVSRYTYITNRPEWWPGESRQSLSHSAE